MIFVFVFKNFCTNPFRFQWKCKSATQSESSLVSIWLRQRKKTSKMFRLHRVVCTALRSSYFHYYIKHSTISTVYSFSVLMIHFDYLIRFGERKPWQVLVEYFVFCSDDDDDEDDEQNKNTREPNKNGFCSSMKWQQSNCLHSFSQTTCILHSPKE